MVESPCTKICVIDRTGRQCEGCGRTLDEIGRWSSASDAEKQRIVARAAARRTVAAFKRR